MTPVCAVHYSLKIGEPRSPTSKASPGIVGAYLRQKREAISLSQRALGQLFEPPVTTQFISNIERGVTPLPPVHVATLVRVLQLPEAELLEALEREYSNKISNRVGRAPNGNGSSPAQGIASFRILDEDRPQFQAVYDAFLKADPKTREAFQAVCETLLHVPKNLTKRT